MTIRSRIGNVVDDRKIKRRQAIDMARSKSLVGAVGTYIVGWGESARKAFRRGY